MIKMPYEQLVEKIKEQAGVSESEINEKVQEKMDQLSGLISKEGAAHIIANELGIKVFDQVQGKLKIKDVLEGMKNIEVVGKITNLFEVREFERDGRVGKVGSCIIGDETGSIRITCWGEKAEELKQFAEGDILKVSSAYVRENRGFKEIHANDNSKIEKNPEGETIAEVKQRSKATRKEIKNLQNGEENIELVGTVVQTFDPRFFEVCPQCGKRAREKEGEGNVCPAHGTVQPNYSYVLNAILDDGTETIRCVFFKNQAEHLTGRSHEQFLTFKDNPGSFEQVKNDLLGQITKLVGRVKKNDMFDRLEFTAQLVTPNPSPQEESTKLKEEIATIESQN